MHVSGWWWLALLVVAPVLVALDVFVVPRGPDPVSRRAATRWTIIWLGIGLAFGAFVWAGWGEKYAIKYTTGFVVEKAMTIDQVLVFALILRTFRPPDRAAHRAVFIAIWVGLLIKVPFIAVGAWLGETQGDGLRFALAAGFFAGGAYFVRHRDREPTVAENRYLRYLSTRLAFVEEWRGDRLIFHEGRQRRYTLAFALVVALITADVYFAATVPLAFASQKPPFLVLASSALAEVGIRSLFWLVNSLDIDPVVLKVTLAVVLWLVAGELLLSDAVHDPSWVLPIALVVVLVIPIVVSTRRRRGAPR